MAKSLLIFQISKCVYFSTDAVLQCVVSFPFSPSSSSVTEGGAQAIRWHFGLWALWLQLGKKRCWYRSTRCAVTKGTAPSENVCPKEFQAAWWPGLGTLPRAGGAWDMQGHWDQAPTCDPGCGGCRCHRSVPASLSASTTKHSHFVTF